MGACVDSAKADVDFERETFPFPRTQYTLYKCQTTRKVRGVIEDPWKNAKRCQASKFGRNRRISVNGTTPRRRQYGGRIEEKEPTLSQIRDMLRDLQKSVAAILKENNNLKEELSQIKSSFQSQGREISKLKETLTKVTNENVSLVSQLEQARKKLRDQEEETTRLWAEQDELEQYSRKNSLEIHGLPENVYSSTEEAVLKLAGALNVEMSASDIEISHIKLRRKGKTFIIAKFVSHKVKTRLYKERTKLKDIRIASVFPSFSNAASAGVNRVYINENLTAYRRQLVAIGREMREDGTINNIWTIDGKVFVKTSPDGSPTRIREEDDFKNL